MEKLLKGRDRSKTNERQVWKAHSAKLRETMLLESSLPGAAGWVSHVGAAHLRGVSLSERLADLLNVSIETTHGSSQPEEVEDLIVDMSQDIKRRPWSVGYCRSLTTSSDLYTAKRGRVVIPLEHFRLLGFPPISLTHLSFAKQRDLSGEAMSPVQMGIVLSVGLGCLV